MAIYFPAARRFLVFQFALRWKFSNIYFWDSFTFAISSDCLAFVYNPPFFFSDSFQDQKKYLLPRKYSENWYIDEVSSRGAKLPSLVRI